jgi:hypothetical protein
MEYQGYVIEHDKTFGMFTIKNVGKGSVPKVLRGRYTSRDVTMKSIDQYKALTKNKEAGGDYGKASSSN